MRKLIKDKHGMVASQIVKIILLILGFAILLWVFSTSLNEETFDREICHESVLFRGALPDLISSKDIVNLKCKTQKFCLTEKTFGKGECEEFKGSDFNTVEISDDNPIEEVNKFIARELASCWAMMEKGEFQIFTRELSTTKKCSICSRIAFDKSLKDDLEGEVNGLAYYLSTREVPNQNVSYWNYLTGQEIIGVYDINLDKFSTDEKAIVFMEMDESNWKDWGGAIFGSTGGAYVGAKAGAAIGFMIPVPGGYAVGALSGGIIGFVSGGTTGWFVDVNKEGEYRTGWDFVDYKGKDLRELGCSSFENIN